jgi:predicted ABC-class ATPase
MEHPGQIVVLQTAVRIGKDGKIEARFTVGLPAQGRRVLGRAGADLLCGAVPALVNETLHAGAHDLEGLLEAAEINEDADHARGLLPGLGLIAWIANGSCLPRERGDRDTPLEPDRVVPFVSPPSLEVEIDLPNGGPTAGMGVRRGVTLVVGGGFHGKSTLLRALASSVHNHAPGDGRERAVTLAGAVSIQAEDGRSVAGVDISPFIDGLPDGRSARHFSSPNASGSTSQAASIMEAVEVGAPALLIDEDTAATNFMIQDRRMQELIGADHEPITPFVDRVRELHEHFGVSSILVLGGSGDYLELADFVVAMRDYRPSDVTERAIEVARNHPTGRRPTECKAFTSRPAREPDLAAVDLRKGRRAVHIRPSGSGRRLMVGDGELDLEALRQIRTPSQLEALSRGIVMARSRARPGGDLASLVRGIDDSVESRGLDALDSARRGDLARFRPIDLALALNRLRGLPFRKV